LRFAASRSPSPERAGVAPRAAQSRFGSDGTALRRRRGNVVTHKVLTFAEVGQGRQKVRRTRQASWRAT